MLPLVFSEGFSIIVKLLKLRGINTNFATIRFGLTNINCIMVANTGLVFLAVFKMRVLLCCI